MMQCVGSPPMLGPRPFSFGGNESATLRRKTTMTTAVVGRRRLLLIFCCIALVSAFVIRSGTNVAARGVQDQASRTGSGERTADCGGEPCAAVVRGGLGVPGSTLARAGRKRPFLRRLPHADRSFPALAGERRKTISASESFSTIQSGCRRSAVPAGRRRRLPHESTRTPAISAICGRTDSIRIVFDLPRHIRLVDPVTNLVSNGDARRRMADGSHGQRRQADGR